MIKTVELNWLFEGCGIYRWIIVGGVALVLSGCSVKSTGPTSQPDKEPPISTGTTGTGMAGPRMPDAGMKTPSPTIEQTAILGYWTLVKGSLAAGSTLIVDSQNVTLTEKRARESPDVGLLWAP
jgi:hypothetical protein